MRNNDVLGIIFSNSHDENLPELTKIRTLGSVPFGCRYRLIDFALSAMVNAGISKVGVITKSNYQSLMDHLGSGKPWDLARKKGGLVILPPFVQSGGVYKGKIDALYNVIQFIERSDEEYVLISDSDIVFNFDLEDMINAHLERDADVTMAYKRGNAADLAKAEGLLMNGDGRIIEIQTNVNKLSGQINAYLNILIVKKSLLISMIKEAMTHNYTNFIVDVLAREEEKLSIYGFEAEGFSTVIDSMQCFFETNMRLLDRSIQKELFQKDRPVFTKLRDDMPSRYGHKSCVENSLIADGCLIEGTVKNSVIFRGVHIAEGAEVENCILMQSTCVGTGTQLGYVVTDKNVTVEPGRTFIGFKSFPLFIGKGLTV